MSQTSWRPRLLGRAFDHPLRRGAHAGRSPRLETLESRVVPTGSVLATLALVEGPAVGSDAVLLSTTGAWSASSNDPWLHVSNPSGSGSGPVSFTFDANSGATRAGTLTIDDQTLTVTQAGAAYVRGTATATLVSGLNGPCGLALNAAGNLYIADSTNQAIVKWDATTQQVTTLVSAGLNNPYGVAVDAAGNVYIADRMGNAVKKWNATDGLTTLVSSGLNYPMSVAVDASGNLFIADTNSNTVKRYDAGSHLVTTVISSGLSLPVGVTMSQAGDLYIADAGNSAVKKWNATDGLTTVVSTGLNSAYSVAVDAAGNLIIADTNGNSVKTATR